MYWDTQIFSLQAILNEHFTTNNIACYDCTGEQIFLSSQQKNLLKLPWEKRRVLFEYNSGIQVDFFIWDNLITDLFKSSTVFYFFHHTSAKIGFLKIKGIKT